MGTYNYKLAKWLSKKLKPLSVNEHTISDIFLSADELQEMEINEHDLLVLYDVSSVFTNVPVDETIEGIAERAFENDWFGEEHSLDIEKSDLQIATKHLSVWRKSVPTGGWKCYGFASGTSHGKRLHV